ncbi:hypothetical protein GQ54DRAFT_145376 [Martensiomyces pterosporus]|nr:hypothetical protein GQ54DRAFT_145376 [Martensiomyces pterosporus]
MKRKRAANSAQPRERASVRCLVTFWKGPFCLLFPSLAPPTLFPPASSAPPYYGLLCTLHTNSTALHALLHVPRTAFQRRRGRRAQTAWSFPSGATPSRRRLGHDDNCDTHNVAHSLCRARHPSQAELPPRPYRRHGSAHASQRSPPSCGTPRAGCRRGRAGQRWGWRCGPQAAGAAER